MIAWCKSQATTSRLVVILWHFGPRLLDLIDQATKPPSTDTLVTALLAANKAAADKAAADKAAADKAAADAAAKKP